MPWCCVALKSRKTFRAGRGCPCLKRSGEASIRGGCLTESVDLVVDREKRLSQLALNERNEEEGGEDINPPAVPQRNAIKVFHRPRPVRFENLSMSLGSKEPIQVHH
jgi:hypothetical protein